MRRKRRHKKRYLKKIIFLTIIFITIAGLGSFLYVNYQLDKIKINPITREENNSESLSNDEYGSYTKKNIEKDSSKLYDEQSKTNNSIVNIALFGVDSRSSKSDPPHSDCIIIATIDYKHNKIKLSSIMRDTYVAVTGHNQTKITEAYTYGGPKLALDTINYNFDLNIKDYVTVDFNGMTKIIDSLGGIDLDVKKYELRELNRCIAETGEIEKKSYSLVKTSGLQTLDGIQTVAYARIRKVGDGDFERTERQRLILNQIISKMKTVSPAKYPYIVSELLPSVETSLDKSEILAVGGKFIFSGISNLEQQRFPVDGYCKGEVVDDIWYLVPKPSLSTTKEQIYNYIFQDIKPLPKDPLF
ncbi:LCP family protein [Clostridium sp. CX1]|uniref:LCP family protein n=1 Tax=Clostridium sp. CX1 TaxID=2978346 RepID=UPI0021BF27C4|nr:LCP family protein [Clostridium sp. CX1]MCT8978080.1 LCP family protein [Clostridium sp. CX1]